MGELITKSYRPGQQQPPPAAPAESIEPATGLPDKVDTCIHGFAKQGFEGIRDAFAANLYSGFAPNRWITGPHEQQRSLNILSATYACLAKLAADGQGT